MTKTIFLLNIGNYAPEIIRLTLPFIRRYAERIGAGIFTISERKFPDWPMTYEKLQIHELARQMGGDWNLYIDSDALIHPDCPDFTIYLPKGTVAFHQADISHIRFQVDNDFLRDGRYIAPGNWFMIASDLCLDLWRPLDMTPAEAVARIYPTANEIRHGITREHLVDDYALAKNISRFGLTFKSFVDIYKERQFPAVEGTVRDPQSLDVVKGYSNEYLFHMYTMTVAEKVAAIENRIKEWQVEHILEQ